MVCPADFRVEQPSEWQFRGGCDRQLLADGVRSPTTASENSTLQKLDFTKWQLWRKLSGRKGHRPAVQGGSDNQQTPIISLAKKPLPKEGREYNQYVLT